MHACDDFIASPIKLNLWAKNTAMGDMTRAAPVRCLNLLRSFVLICQERQLNYPKLSNFKTADIFIDSVHYMCSLIHYLYREIK